MAAVEHAAEQAPNAQEYIVHHLTFLSNKKAGGIVDFTVINWDSVFFSVLLGCGLFALSFFSDKSGYDQSVSDATRKRSE